MIEVAGFSTHNKEEVRAILEGAGIQFAMFQPASFIVIPPPPTSVIVHVRDAIIVKSVAGNLVSPGKTEMVDDDYFEWHAPDDYTSMDLDYALKGYVAAHTADLKRPKHRGDVMRRLNARMKLLPRVVPNENFVGDPEPFVFEDGWSQPDDFAIKLWHENGGFTGTVFLGFDGGITAQVDDLQGNSAALAKWLRENS